MSRKPFAAVVLALAFVAASAIAADKPNPTKPRKTIELISFGGGGNWPVWVAQEKGLFAKHGATVKQTITPNSVFQIQGMVDGKFDIATTAYDNVVAYQEGQGEAELKKKPDLFVFMGGYAGGLRLNTAPEIKSFDALKGKAVGVDAATTGFAFILYKMLDLNGVKQGEYQVEKLGGTPARVEALMQGKIAATMITSPAEIGPEAKGYNRLADTTTTFGAYQASVGAARRSWATQNRANLVAFIRAYVQAIDWLYDPKNKDEALAIYAKYLPNVPKPAVEKSYDIMLGGTNEGFQKRARFDPAGARTVLKLRSEFAKPKKNLTEPMKYVNETYYRQALR
jgi:ABC-type nitrate/sulfonate/bicarbonate transport system substrate-binding protein